MVSPAQRKAGVGYVVKKQLCTERQACRYLKVSRSIVYRSKQAREESVENQLILKLNQEKVIWGILKVTSYIRNKYGKNIQPQTSSPNPEKIWTPGASTENMEEAPQRNRKPRQKSHKNR